MGAPSAGDVESAARAFIEGDITTARTQIEAHLYDNPTDARALRLLTEIRIEESRRARESGVATPTRRAAAGPEAATPPRPPDPARGFERTFGSSAGATGKAVHTIRAWGDANRVEIEILASADAEANVERKGREILVTFLTTSDALPRGEFTLPAGPAPRVVHAANELEATLRVFHDEDVRVVSGGGPGRVYLKIERQERILPPATDAEGEYRAPEDGGGFSVRLEGDGQQGVADAVLPRPVVAHVSRGGAPAAGVRVVFASPDPELAFDVDPSTREPEASGLSDTAGVVRAYVRLGRTVGRRVFRAMVEGSAAEASGEIYCVRSAPETIRVVSGSEQSLFVRRGGGEPLVVDVTDRFGNPVSGAVVEWTFASGNGRLDADPTTAGVQTTSTTDDRGQARLLEYGMGPLKGRQVIQASVSGADASRFVTFEFDVQPVLVTLDSYDYSVVDVIQRFGEVAGWNIALSQGVLALSGEAQRVTVHFENAPAEEALSQILALKGLTRIETPDGTIKIMTFLEAIRSGHPVTSGRNLSSVSSAEEVVTHTVRLNNLLAADLAGLRDLLSQNGILQTNVASNSLILTDYASNIRKVLALIEELDQTNFAGGDGRFLVVYKLRNISPTELQSVIDATIDIPTVNSRREDVGGRQTTITTVVRRIYSFPLAGQRQFVAFASDRDHRQLALLIDELDNEELAASRDLTIEMRIPQHAPAAQIADWFRRNLLNQLAVAQTSGVTLREYAIVHGDSAVIFFARQETLERVNRLWTTLDRPDFRFERMRIVATTIPEEARLTLVATAVTNAYTSAGGQDVLAAIGPVSGTILLTGEPGLFNDAEALIRRLESGEWKVATYRLRWSPNQGLIGRPASGIEVSGTTISEVLTQSLSTGGNFANVGVNAFIFWGAPVEVDRAMAILREIDEAWKDGTNFEIIPIRHRTAQEIRDDATPLLYGSFFEFVPLASVNSILLVGAVGPVGRWEYFRNIIVALDTAIPTRIYTPRNSTVENVVESLRTVFPLGPGASSLRIAELRTDGAGQAGQILLQGRADMLDQAIRLASEIDSSVAHVLYHGRVQHPTGMLNALVTATWPQLMTFPINVIATGDEWMVIKGPAHLLPEAIKLCESVDTYASFEVYYPSRRTVAEVQTILFDLFPHTGFTPIGNRALVIQGERRAVDDCLRIAKQLDDLAYKSYAFEQAPSEEILRYVTNAFQSGYFRLAEPRPVHGGVILVWADQGVHDRIQALLDSVDHPDFRGSRIRSWTIRNYSATAIAQAIGGHFSTATNNPLTFGAGLNNVLTAQGDPRDLDQAEAMIREIEAGSGEFRIYTAAYEHLSPNLITIAQQFVPEVTILSLGAAGNGLERLLARGPREALDRLSALSERLNYPGEIALYRPRRRSAALLAADLLTLYSHSSILSADNSVLMQGDTPIVQRMLETARQLDVEQASEFVPLLRASTAEAQTLLASLFGGNLTVATVTGAGGVLLIGDASLISEARAKLADIDRGLPWKQFRLRHTTTANMATAILATFPSLTPVQLTGGQGLILFGPYEALEEVGDFIRRIDSPDVEVVTLREITAAEVTAPLAAAFPGVTATQIGTLNSFVLTGEPVSVREAKKFLAAVDRSKHTAIRPLKYYSPRPVNSAVATGGEAAASVPALQTILIQYLSPGGVIQYDLQSNAFLITDSLDRVTRVLEVIDQLDQAPPQFLIEAVIAEVRLGDGEALGVSWTLQPNLDALGLATPTITFNPTEPTPSGAVAVAISQGDLQATFTALTRNRDVRVVTSPKIVTRNNVEAEINAGTQIAVPTLSVNNTNTTERVTITFEDVPRRLRVTPTSIVGSNIVRLTVEVNVSTRGEAAGSAGGIAITAIDPRTITTTVDILDGHTLILGGLIDEVEIEQNDKVPFLGDLPGLGALFRSSSKTVSKQELLVFLSPRVLTPANTVREMENEIARYQYLVNFPVDWTGRRFRSNVVSGLGASGAPSAPSFVPPASGAGSSVRMLSEPVAPTSPAPAPAPAPVAAAAPATLDLNTASSTQLAQVPGLNPGTASLVVAYRAENGPFASVAQLSNVPGLTPTAVAQASAYLVVGGGAPRASGAAPAPVAPVPSGLVDLNTADVATLRTLPGVEEFHARMILAYRNTYGAFRRVEDLQEVPGITPDLYAGIRNRVAIGGGGTAGAGQPLPVSTRIDLNDAGEAELLRAGLTQSQAKLVIAYRQTYGPYRAVDDLLQVPGITPEVLSRVRGVVAVGAANGGG